MRRLPTAAGLSTVFFAALLAAACGSTPAATSTPSSTVINLGLPTSVTSFANADAQGGDVVIIGSYTDRLTVSMVTPDSIHSPAGLRGKRLGIQTVGAFREVMTRMILEGAGLTPADATYVPVASTGYISALLQGSIQSAILQQEQVISVLQKDSKLHVLVNLYQSRPYYFYGAYLVSRPWLAHHQGAAERFLTAIVRAHRFMYQHQAATVRTVAAATGFTQAVISQAYDVLLGQEGVFPVNEGLEPSRVTQTLQTMQKYKVLTGTAPAESTLVDTAPITAVIHKLGAWTGDPRWH